MKTVVSELLRGFGQLVYPDLCEGCNKSLIRGLRTVCSVCESYLPYTNHFEKPANPMTRRLTGRIHFEHAAALINFTEESVAQHLIHRLKYKNRKEVGFYFGKKIGAVIQDWNVDVIIPVPLHPKKLAKRGYNQSSLIGEGIAEMLQKPLLTDVLLKKIHTSTQTDKTREQRIENVYGSFELLQTEKIKGLHVLIVDDVLTTGATVEACADTLLEVKDVRLSIVTIGLVEN